MVEFYLLTFPRFLLRKKEHKSYFGKNRTHDFRTSRCADYLLDHSGDDLRQQWLNLLASTHSKATIHKSMYTTYLHGEYKVGNTRGWQTCKMF